MRGTVSTPPFAPRKLFSFTIGAWDPLGSPPAGMPADAINLLAADLASAFSLPVQSAPLGDHTYPEIVTVDYDEFFQRASDSADVEVAFDVGTLADPTVGFGGLVNLTSGADAFLYPAAVKSSEIVVTIEINTGDVATFGGLKPGVGRATIHVILAVLPPSTIRRVSP